MPPGPGGRTPRTRVRRSRAATKLSGSLISVTTAVSGKTFETIPTRPSPLTTGEFVRIPEDEPAAIVTECVKAPPGKEMTAALTAR